MIWDTLIWRLECSNRSKIRSAQKCNPCLRYELSPMSPGRTFVFWSGRWESNPRPKLGKLLYCHCTTPARCHISVIILKNKSLRTDASHLALSSKTHACCAAAQDWSYTQDTPMCQLD